MNKTGLVTLIAACSREMLGALLAIPLLLLLSLVVLQYGNQWMEAVANTGAYSIAGAAGLLALGVLFLFLHVTQREHPYDPRLFLACSVASAVVLYWAYVSSIQVAWISDFKGMWDVAGRMVARGDYSVSSIYNERALPVLVPLILLFGAKASLVPVLNIGMLLGIQLAGYDLVRRIAGHRAAQGFMVIWLGAMEPVMALPITSHDIWGLFYLVAFLWGFRVLNDRAAALSATTRRWWLLGAGVAALALVLTLLDMQRELAPFVILGFVLAGLMLALNEGLDRPGVRRTLCVAVSIFIVHLGMATALMANGFMLTAEQGAPLSQIRVGAYGSSLSSGRYGQGQLITNAFFKTVDERSRENLVKVIPLSDFALQPGARLSNIMFRARGQAYLGSQYYFYQANAQTRWDWLLPMSRAYNVCYSIVVAALGLWLVLPVLRRLRSIDGLAQFAMLSTLVGLLLLVGESQPRYIFPLWFVLPQLAAIAMESRARASEGPTSTWRPWGWDMTRGAALLLGMFFLLSFAFRSIYGEKQGRILSGWTPGFVGADARGLPPKWFRHNQRISAAGIRKDDNDSRSTGFGDMALVLKIPTLAPPGASTTAGKKICIGQKRTALDFYYFMPYQNPRATGAFTLGVLVDGQARWAVHLPGTTSIRHARIDKILPPGRCARLEFKLTSNRGLPMPSWVEASQVDIYFPRLEE